PPRAHARLKSCLLFYRRHIPTLEIKRAKSWFQTNRIQVMEWPIQSPDLNPIENLWADIKNAVHEAKPRNAEELWNIVQLSWAAIPVDRCQKLVDSIYHRCEAVIRNRGYATKY
uniref:Tc1-like transposase DDE domain-containing protein n=1 Tax=Seriola dumerili TaxID=41447 RepID=A0A3B4V9Q6_SERDU